MSAVILEINDAGLQAQAGGDVLVDSPGYVTQDGRDLVVGPEALARVKLDPTRTEYQFWEKLGMDALVKSSPRAGTQADLAFAHLEAVWNEIRAVSRDLIVVVPGDLQRDQLGLLLGMARRLEMPIRALVDTAVAASLAPAPGRVLHHLDAQLHRCVLTRLDQGAWLERVEVQSQREVGLLRIREAWSHAVASLFVQSTRFDPMHQAETEQWVYDQLGRWISHLAEHEHLDIDLPWAGRTHSIRLHRRQVIKAAEPLYRRLREFVTDLLPDGQPVTLQLSHRLALPGLVAMLENLPEVDVVVLDALATRNGVGRLYLGHGEDGDKVPYVDRVPWFSARDLDVHGEALASHSRRRPTHLLHNSVAHALSEGAFSVGTRLAEATRGIRLEHVPDVSAEHFRLASNGERVTLEDLSGGHTLVNDDPVNEAVAVAVGDRIRIGAGTEFLLIVVED